jgi:delta8-fatty-acid desaturase
MVDRTLSFHTATMASRLRILSPADIQRQITDGELIVVHEGYVLNVGAFIDQHPGGRLAMLHMIGRDASDEINMYAAT